MIEFKTDRDCAKWDSLTPKEINLRRYVFWELFSCNVWTVRHFIVVLSSANSRDSIGLGIRETARNGVDSHRLSIAQ